MNQGSKYYALYHFLRQIGEHEVSLTFTELEQLLDGLLAPTARTQRAWWSNRRTGSAQANAWIDAGYHVAGVDLTAERVLFRKPTPVYQIKRQGGALRWDSELIKLLRRHTDPSHGIPRG